MTAPALPTPEQIDALKAWAVKWAALTDADSPRAKIARTILALAAQAQRDTEAVEDHAGLRAAHALEIDRSDRLGNALAAAEQRTRQLEAALRAQALATDYGDQPCFCGDDARNPPVTADHIPSCKQARAALGIHDPYAPPPAPVCWWTDGLAGATRRCPLHGASVFLCPAPAPR